MSAQPAPSTPPVLRLVTDDGEIIDAESVQLLRDQIAGLEAENRSWHYKYAQLARDREAEALEDPLWPKAMEIFDRWRAVCNHRGAQWTHDRFEMVKPYLKSHPPIAIHFAAVEGIHLDHAVKTRANGSTKHHDDWHILYRDTDRFEEAINSAPRNVLVQLKIDGHLPLEQYHARKKREKPKAVVPTGADRLPLEATG